MGRDCCKVKKYRDCNTCCSDYSCRRKGRYCRKDRYCRDDCYGGNRYYGGCCDVYDQYYSDYYSKYDCCRKKDDCCEQKKIIVQCNCPAPQPAQQ